MSSAPDPATRPAADRSGPAEPHAGEPARLIDSRQLLQGHKEVVILHLGSRYRLQETRAGKLILIK